MNSQDPQVVSRRPGFLTRDALEKLFIVLSQLGYQILGPVVRDGAIQFDTLSAADQLPRGVSNDQQPGHYRLEQGENQRQFDWNHGPQGLKPVCFSPREVLWAEQSNPPVFNPVPPNIEPTAVVGVRACDLAALAIQDRHFLSGSDPDPHYRQRRESLLLIGVDCARSAATCFCASTGDGPALDGGYDIGMAELDEGFLIWRESDKGRTVIDQLDLLPASDAQLETMLQSTTQASLAQQRNLPDCDELLLLYKRLEHAHWDNVAERCLSCGNCTAVCPTCFCYEASHEMSLDGETAQMVRQWDSCFSATHSSMGQYQVRPTVKQRYRQWLTHKLAGWQSQQGRIGCTGCGRCIAWCPVGIDLTAETVAVLEEGSLDV
ncbi:MAG: 4Fe-4S dicluster domain-containing protein [Candidatus Thiodiazotropha sp. (ex Myrtea sp. 'scaly one' KF741663)]|nr:4Fe-4S dicluster domain-containing protein [Candidatus Thiodiazotropha sp. (ex Myrtea sp. 'scaly one' KF741663)]